MSRDGKRCRQPKRLLARPVAFNATRAINRGKVISLIEILFLVIPSLSYALSRRVGRKLAVALDRLGARSNMWKETGEKSGREGVVVERLTLSTARFDGNWSNDRSGTHSFLRLSGSLFDANIGTVTLVNALHVRLVLTFPFRGRTAPTIVIFTRSRV